MERALREVNGSLLVAVPRPLAEKFGWRAGDLLTFNQRGSTLVVSRTERAIRARTAFTIGYEGRHATDFISTLQRSGVKQLIDVRERPLSRKAGFSKNRLRDALTAVGIAYVHLRELGSPSDVRDEYRSDGDFKAFEKKYEAHLRQHGQPLTILRSLVATEPSAIMCFEHDWKACHRSILCRGLEADGFRFRHL